MEWHIWQYLNLSQISLESCFCRFRGQGKRGNYLPLSIPRSAKERINSDGTLAMVCFFTSAVTIFDWQSREHLASITYKLSSYTWANKYHPGASTFHWMRICQWQQRSSKQKYCCHSNHIGYHATPSGHNAPPACLPH